MSWDIFAQDLPTGVHDVSEIPDDFEPRPIGDRSAIAARIREIIPMIQFGESGWGKIDEPGCSMEIDLGLSETVTSVAFHVYGGDLAPRIVADLLRQLGWRALDPASETGLFDASEPASSYTRWRQYRDRERPTSEERKTMRQAFKQRERAESEARLPLSKSQLAELFEYVKQQFDERGCDHSLRFSERFLADRGLDIAAVTGWLIENGGGCDCEVLANVESEWSDRM